MMITKFITFTEIRITLENEIGAHVKICDTMIIYLSILMYGIMEHFSSAVDMSIIYV